ncbi:unnamed protein product [Parascedosporium putredinis]|uniref:Uncharacterized protein n=1 Tax=Parascedosporium putredinis TaxID=1442378 RepID=A0A9P1GWB8_9PEZI|nr:unnamed protein product [Parascedosporium putredinis]CAI7988184.1 unnamed protein product [Parascedosporium putredinis]
MKTYFALAALAQAFLVMADQNVEPRDPFFGGRGGGGRGNGPFGWEAPAALYLKLIGFQPRPLPQKECVSSYWETATPTPAAFCDSDSDLKNCVSAACSAQADEYSSYSERSSSLCSKFQSCDSTGTFTYTRQTPDGDWPFGGGYHGTRTWPTGEVVVTGCPWDGDGWGRETVTVTVAQPGNTEAVFAVEKAVKDDTTTSRTLGLAAATGTSDGSSAGSTRGVKIMGLVLGAVVGTAILL